MNIPKNIRLGGEVIIVRIFDFTDTENLPIDIPKYLDVDKVSRKLERFYGYWEPNLNQIWINSFWPDEVQLNTFYHELIHAFFEFVNEGSDMGRLLSEEQHCHLVQLVRAFIYDNKFNPLLKDEL